MVEQLADSKVWKMVDHLVRWVEMKVEKWGTLMVELKADRSVCSRVVHSVC